MYTCTENSELFVSFLSQLTKPVLFQNTSVSFFCVIEGELLAGFGDHRSHIMKSGDLFFSRDADTISLKPAKSTLLLHVHFDYFFFYETLGQDFYSVYCNSMEEPDKDYSKLISSLAELALLDVNHIPDDRFLELRQIYSLFHLLKAEYLQVSKQPEPTRKPEQKAALLLQYIREHCSEPLTLRDAAAYMHYTPQYLSQFIKKNLNSTFNTCLNHARMEKASLLLKYRKDAPFKIAADCGFSSYRTFCQHFQDQFGTTPEQYRVDFTESFHYFVETPDFIEDPSVVSDRLLNLVCFVDEKPRRIEPLKHEHHTIDLTVQTTCRKNWDQIINLGDALKFDNPLFRQHIAVIQESFHFSYGRFGNILRLIDILYEPGSREDPTGWHYDYSRAFHAIDYLLSLGLKPHMDFGGKPFEIYLPDVSISTEQILDSLDYHEMIFEPFLQACIDRYGFDRVDTWNFEYWMYYNNTLTHVESPEHYSRMFAKFYHTIRALLPTAKVGAPGFNLALPSALLKETLQVLYAQWITPDFISLLYFPYETGKVIPEGGSWPVSISSDPDHLHRRIDEIRGMLDGLYPKAPDLYVTEYSTVVSSLNYVNDSLYQGSFILKQTLDNLDSVPVMAYWLATDYSMYYPDSAELLFGGNGLLTKDGIFKPGYHAQIFLSRLGSQLNERGEHYIVTSTPPNEIRIILYHYTHLSNKYLDDPARYAHMRNPDSAFLPEPPLQIELDLFHAKPGSYKISTYDLTTEHGSILHQWMQIGYSRHIGPAETEHLKSTSIPKMTLNRIEVKNTIHISHTLGRNEATLIILRRLY